MRDLLGKLFRLNLWLLKPTKVFLVPLHGATTYFWVALKLDWTSVIRIPAYFAISFLGRDIALMFETGAFMQAGTGSENCVGDRRCKQAGNGIDLLAAFLGIELHHRLGMPEFDLNIVLIIGVLVALAFVVGIIKKFTT